VEAACEVGEVALAAAERARRADLKDAYQGEGRAASGEVS
jgi:hypothetical protein